MDHASLETIVGKLLRWSIVLAPVVLIAYFTAMVTQIVIARWAINDYYSQKPSTEDECKQIRAGMDLPQVLRVINRKAEPFEEVLKPDRFTFWRERYSCVVELDPKTQKVVKTHLEDSPEWPPRAIAGYF